MRRALIITKKQFQMAITAIAVVAVGGVLLNWNLNKPAPAAVQPVEPRVIDMVTGEFSSTDDSGKELEVYLWTPGTIIVNKGELTQIRISGVNGSHHPFVIKGLGIEGEVQKGKTTTITFTPQKAGIYAIECLTHTDMANGGPMVGYIVVQD
ncbi:cupredoxin domain-containing protein [Paenibacillus sp. HB172176]|uniref:cupredoxin domain-containing protein n=1 Tax=Paenibacillus sp. HB172176 TaxID=2493690 RepID=UPI00143A6764|nr:cupredoxin domain-containing protein [Paenibacillus sp. HB172176]